MFDILSRSFGHATRIEIPVNATIPASTPKSSGSAPLYRLAASAVAAYRRQRRRSAAIAELRKLSDHMLKDIGLLRDDIPTVVDAMLARADQRSNGDPALNDVEWRNGAQAWKSPNASGNDNRPDLAA